LVCLFVRRWYYDGPHVSVAAVAASRNYDVISVFRWGVFSAKATTAELDKFRLDHWPPAQLPIRLLVEPIVVDLPFPPNFFADAPRFYASYTQA
jgi:hypothetical protein